MPGRNRVRIMFLGKVPRFLWTVAFLSLHVKNQAQHVGQVQSRMRSLSFVYVLVLKLNEIFGTGRKAAFN